MTTLTPTSQPATSSPLRSLIIRHPLVAFFVIAFTGAWITILPLLLARNGFGLLPLTLPVHDLIPGLPLVTTGSFTGPTLAAVIVTAATIVLRLPLVAVYLAIDMIDPHHEYHPSNACADLHDLPPWMRTGRKP